MMPRQKKDVQDSFPIEEEVTSRHLGRLSSYTRLLTGTEKIDPVTFFNQINYANKNRSFWGEPNRDFYIVGVGTAYEMVADNNRYETTENKWSALKDQAIVFNKFPQAGTGLVALGGMSFDPKRRQDSMWEQFPSSQLIIPEILLTVDQDKQYLTTNVLLTDCHLNEPLKDIHEQLLETLQKRSQETSDSLQVVAKEEQAVPEWKTSVQRAIDEIQSKRAEKIVLARELRVSLKDRPHIGTIIQGLLQTQPTSYVFAIERGNHCFIGATPERLVQVNGKDLLSTCLAGTAPRGNTKEADEQQRRRLFNDPKNRLEHDHVVQMIRQGIAPYCEDVHIPETPTVKTLKNLHHLYTSVKATLKKNHSIFNIVAALHPTPALGGVPREKALAFIRDYEFFDRGWFGAPVGWLDSQGHGEFAVAIRSGLIQNNIVSLFAGCGVMGDSNIEEEYEETGIKFLPLLNVLEGNYDVH